LVRHNITERLKRNGMGYEQIREITSKLDSNALTIGFARRFATYKRATLIFKDLERITQILNDQNKKVQIIFAGKAHPKDIEGQDYLRYINEISTMPQFKGKVFVLENYNINIARHLVSGVDVWLNNPRRPMEASGTSGEKASVNGIINFSVLDGWWAEGYNQKNGWAIGTNAEYDSYESQDVADSENLYSTLEEKIIPLYYNVGSDGIPNEWVKVMKESIISTGGNYSMHRQVIDYTNQLYMPLCNLTKKYFQDIETVTEYTTFKDRLNTNWKDLVITQENNFNNVTVDAGNKIEVKCKVKVPNIRVENLDVQTYCGKIMQNGIVENIAIIPMELVDSNEEEKIYTYSAKVKLSTGGDYGYTFRVMPKHEMLLDSANLNLIKWITE
jgi:starch phosphorylase